MPLTRITKGYREYLYFGIGTRKLYLGTPDSPKAYEVRAAIEHVDKTIKRYQEEKTQLEALLTIAENSERSQINSLSDDELEKKIEKSTHYTSILQTEKKRRVSESK
jgi:hypothetical protein